MTALSLHLAFPSTKHCTELSLGFAAGWALALGAQPAPCLAQADVEAPEDLSADAGGAGSEPAARARGDQHEQHDLDLLAHLERAYELAADRIDDAVVSVEVERAEPDGARRTRSVAAYSVRPGTPASGLHLRRGLVLTSAYHVEDAVKVYVVGRDGARHEAERLGRDDALEIALLRVPALAGAPLAQDALRLDEPDAGSFIVNVARGPSGLRTVNTGIVSARGRFRGRVIQTDAAVNHVNIGGAAVDIAGRLVGMPVRLSARTGVNSGVGFIVPTARLLAVLPVLETGTIIPKPARAFLGIQLGREHVDPPGLEVESVLEGTAAEKAGLRRADVIERIDGSAITDGQSLTDVLAEKGPGDPARVEVRRGERRLAIELTLGERPEE